jgi:hypothetical protein
MPSVLFFLFGLVSFQLAALCRKRLRTHVHLNCPLLSVFVLALVAGSSFGQPATARGAGIRFAERETSSAPRALDQSNQLICTALAWPNGRASSDLRQSKWVASCFQRCASDPMPSNKFRYDAPGCLTTAHQFVATESAPGAAGGVAKGPIADAVPKNLTEQLALQEAKASGGVQIMENLGDAPRLVANYGGGTWVKMQSVLRGANATRRCIGLRT